MFGGYIILAVVALATALAILLWPAKTAGVLLLFAPIIWGLGAADIQFKESAPPSFVTAISGAATLMYARYLLRPQQNPILVWLQRAAILYCLAVLPSVFLNPSFKTAAGYVRLISPIVFMFAVLRCSRPRGVHTFQFKALALSTLSMLGIILVAQFSDQGSFYMGGFERLRAFNLWPQSISVYSVAVVGVLICGVLLGKRRYVYVIGILGLLGCTYLTGYRTAWVGLTVLVGLVMVIAVRSGLAKFVALLGALGLVGASGIIIQSVARYTRGDEAISTEMLNDITSGRITTDSIAWDRYVAGTPSEWAFGIGVNGAQETTLQEEGTPWGIHSDFLATLIECGVLGAVAYIMLLITTAWTLLRVMNSLPRQHPGHTFAAVGLACFVAFTIMGIPGAMYTNVFVGWYYYGFIGLVLAQFQKHSLESRQSLETPFLDLAKAAGVS
jgi:O-antigen ligase